MAGFVRPHNDKASVGQRRDRARHLRAFRGGVDDELITRQTAIGIEDLRTHGRVGLVVTRVAVVVPDHNETAVAKRCEAASVLATCCRGVYQKLTTPLNRAAHHLAPPLKIKRLLISRGSSAWRLSPRVANKVP